MNLTFEGVSDEDLSSLHSAVVAERHKRMLAKLADPDYCEPNGLPHYYIESPNRWSNLVLNRTTLANMGRDIKGTPIEKKAKGRV